MLDILITALSSVGLFSFVQFLIQRKDRKKDLLAEVLKKTKKLEKDSIRTQMLLMMFCAPGEKKEILTLAERYFVDLKGNWYMTSFFRSFLIKQSIEPPHWFKDSM